MGTSRARCVRTFAILACLCASATSAEALAQLGPAVRYRFAIDQCDLRCATPSAYVDAEPDSGLRDWNCNRNTYENHQGTDFGLVGGFAAQAQGRTVVAAAPGQVIDSHDGEPDRCTSGQCGGGGGLGNYVALLHPDGRTTVYGHLKRYSIVVPVGEHVQCGMPLGQVGSSGNSTGPHLHFELRDRDGAVLDPYAQRPACGSQAESYWTEQGVYGGLPGIACDPTAADAALVRADVALVRLDTAAPESSLSADGNDDDDAGISMDARPGGPTQGCACVTSNVRLASHGAIHAVACVAAAAAQRRRRRRHRTAAAPDIAPR
jgi:hypothetical protein